MKDRNFKTEQYKLWFYDLEGTAKLLSEKSAAGYHLQSVDTDSGRFTYKRGEAENYHYEINVNGDTKNLAVFTDAYEEVCRATGLVFYRKTEDSSAGTSVEKRSFKKDDTASEEKYLSEKAKEGYTLLRCSMSEYVFEMQGKSDITYKIDYRENIENPLEYIDEFRRGGFEYLCGCDSYHYFYSENGERFDIELFEGSQSRMEKNKNREFESILWTAVMGIIFAAVKIIFDYSKYLDAVLPEALQTLSKSLVMDAAALIVCIAFLIWTAVKRKNG